MAISQTAAVNTRLGRRLETSRVVSARARVLVNRAGQVDDHQAQGTVGQFHRMRQQVHVGAAVVETAQQVERPLAGRQLDLSRSAERLGRG
jgi:hypothetical protein